MLSQHLLQGAGIGPNSYSNAHYDSWYSSLYSTSRTPDCDYCVLTLPTPNKQVQRVKVKENAVLCILHTSVTAVTLEW